MLSQWWHRRAMNNPLTRPRCSRFGTWGLLCCAVRAVQDHQQYAWLHTRYKVSTTAAYLRLFVCDSSVSKQSPMKLACRQTQGYPTGNFAWGPLSTRTTTAGPGKFAGAKLAGENATTVRKRGKFSIRCEDVDAGRCSVSARIPNMPPLCFHPRRNVWKRIFCGQPVLFEACLSCIFQIKQPGIRSCVCVCVRVCACMGILRALWDPNDRVARVSKQSRVNDTEMGRRKDTGKNDRCMVFRARWSVVAKRKFASQELRA